MNKSPNYCQDWKKLKITSIPIVRIVLTILRVIVSIKIWWPDYREINGKTAITIGKITAIHEEITKSPGIIVGLQIREITVKITEITVIITDGKITGRETNKITEIVGKISKLTDVELNKITETEEKINKMRQIDVRMDLCKNVKQFAPHFLVTSKKLVKTIVQKGVHEIKLRKKGFVITAY